MKRKFFLQDKALPDRNPFRVGKAYLVLKDYGRQAAYSKEVAWQNNTSHSPFVFQVAKEGDLFYVKKMYEDLTFQVVTCKKTDEVVFASHSNTYVMSLDDMYEYAHKSPYPCKLKVATIKKEEVPE